MILSFQADREPDGWEDEEPKAELAEMAQVRSELAAGGLRLVYLGARALGLSRFMAP